MLWKWRRHLQLWPPSSVWNTGVALILKKTDIHQLGWNTSHRSHLPDCFRFLSQPATVYAATFQFLHRESLPWASVLVLNNTRRRKIQLWEALFSFVSAKQIIFNSISYWTVFCFCRMFCNLNENENPKPNSVKNGTPFRWACITFTLLIFLFNYKFSAL